MESGPRWGGGCGCTTRRGAMSVEVKLFERTHHLG